MNFCSDKRLDSIFSLFADPVVHCERVASVQTPSISRAGGCWSHHQANTQNTNIMQTEKLLHVPREMPSQAGMASVWYSGVWCITCRCLCSVPCLQYTLVLAAGVARDCQPGRRGPSISRDIISGADTLTSRGHTRDTWPHT